MKVGDLVEYCHSTKPEIGVVLFVGGLLETKQIRAVFPDGNAVWDFQANFRVVKKAPKH